MAEAEFMDLPARQQSFAVFYLRQHVYLELDLEKENTHIHTYVHTYIHTDRQTDIHTYHYITLHHITSHHITSHYITLHYIPYIQTDRQTYLHYDMV